ncbi:MAG: hypothetical protein K6U89_11275 [Chloroflexi bacterium]|nr:hypothetical protein [Chloroflexota bacterium]
MKEPISRWGSLPPATGVLVAVLVAFALRLINLGERSFWTDEGYSAWLSAQPIATILTDDPFHPPLYPLLLKGWTALGPWFDSDAGRRLPSALAGALVVGVGAATVRALALPGAGLAAALLATSALGVWYSQEQRSVALTALLVSVAAAALAGIGARLRCQPAHTPPPGLLVSYGLAALMACYLHYGAIPLLALLNLLFLIAVRPRGPALRAWLLTTALILVLAFPLLPLLARALDEAAGHRFAERALLLFLPGLAAGTGVLLGVGWLSRHHSALARPLAGAAALAFILALDASMLTLAGNSVKRHLALVAPLALAAAAVALARWRPLLGWAAVAAGLPALGLVVFVHPKEEWRPVAALLHQQEQPGDMLLLYQGYEGILLRRYYHGSLPIMGFDEGEDPALAHERTASARRVWLVEVNPTVPPSLVPTLERQRPRLASWSFYRIAVVLFGEAASSG